MNGFVHYVALVVCLTPFSWAGFAIATIHKTTFALVCLGLSFVLPYCLVVWYISEGLSLKHSETVPSSLIVSGLGGLCSFAIWSYIVCIDQISIRNPAGWAGLVLLCLYRRLDISLLCSVAVGLILGYIMQSVIASTYARPDFPKLLCFLLGLGWIGSVVSPFTSLIDEGCLCDIAEARLWLLPSLDGSIALISEHSIELGLVQGGPDALGVPFAQPRQIGSVVLEVRNLIKPRRRQVDTLASLLRLRFPMLPVEEVSGERSFARVRVTFENEAAAVASIKAIAREASKQIDVREVPGTRVFDSPRD